MTVVGAGNAHDLPLTRLLDRAASVTLADLDGHAVRRALRRESRSLRRRARIASHDVTGGAADRIVRAAAAGRPPQAPRAPAAPLPSGPSDVVIGDLLYSQLLYPALLDAGLDPGRVEHTLRQFGQALTDSVVARLHASARGGLVVHVHDVLGWWDGHEQPFTIDDAVIRAQHGHAALRDLVARASRPLGCDPLIEAHRAGALVDYAAWRWPFAPGTDYLVQATVFRA